MQTIEAVQTSPILAVLEDFWSVLRAEHGLPAVTLVIASGSHKNKPGDLTMGSFNPARWTTGTAGELRDEIMIAAESFKDGAIEVLDTMLHEAAHVLARARGIKDTSRAGRYHNKRYKALAEELGLVVACDTVIGWSTTSVPDATAERYRKHLEALGAVLSGHRRHEADVFSVQAPSAPQDAPEGGDEDPAADPDAGDDGGKSGGKRGLYVCVCQPPRKLRVSKSVAELGAILCGVCGVDFSPDGA